MASDPVAFESVVLNRVNDAVVGIDNAGVVTYLNAAAERQYGVRAAEVIGRPLSALYSYEWVRTEDEARAATALAHDGFWRGENRHILRDGRVLHVDSSVTVLQDAAGAPAGLLAIIRDITEAKRIEAELRTREERFRRALAIETVGVLFFSLAGGITDANASFERMSGYTVDELRQIAHWRQLTVPEFHGVTARAADDLLTRGDTAPYEKQMVRPDGSRWWGLFAPRRISGTGATAECVEFIIDITDAKRAEELLLDADRRKDEFLAILAHELRNPLAPIRTAVGILRSPGVPEPLLKRSRDIIDRQVAHMTRLIDDLLDVSRLSRGKVTLQRGPLLLDQVLDAAVETARPLIDERGHTFEQHRAGSPVCIDGDLARLSQVFANLLNNAAKYTPNGGRISLDVSATGGSVDVRVADTGQGIDADRLDSIFELFSQGSGPADSSVGGLGIGLALARRLAELHGGNVRASSAGAGQGATFIVTLPTIDGDTCERAADEPVLMRNLGRRVLVVDDTPDAADTTATLLQGAGCTVRTAYSGKAALTAVASFDPEIVLLDLGMPGLNGLEACRRIRSLPNGASVFVVALTGWGQDEDRRRTRDAGFDAHLVKPVAPDALLDIVEQAPR